MNTTTQSLPPMTEATTSIGHIQTLVRIAHENFKDSGSHEDAELWHQARELEENYRELLERVGKERQR